MRKNKLGIYVMLACGLVFSAGASAGGRQEPRSETEGPCAYDMQQTCAHPQPSETQGDQGGTVENGDAETSGEIESSSPEQPESDAADESDSSETSSESTPSQSCAERDHTGLIKYFIDNECRPYEIRIYRTRPTGLYGFLCGDLSSTTDFDRDVLPHVAGTDGCVEMKVDQIKEALYFCFSNPMLIKAH